MVVDTYAGPVRVEWDSDAAVTALGHFAFLVEYLKLSGRFDALVADCPLVYASGNAPAVQAAPTDAARNAWSCTGSQA